MPSNDDNRADQMNPNNDAYWESSGYDERPDNWDNWDEMNGVEGVGSDA